MFSGKWASIHKHQLSSWIELAIFMWTAGYQACDPWRGNRCLYHPAMDHDIAGCLGEFKTIGPFFKKHKKHRINQVFCHRSGFHKLLETPSTMTYHDTIMIHHGILQLDAHWSSRLAQTSRKTTHWFLLNMLLNTYMFIHKDSSPMTLK